MGESETHLALVHRIVVYVRRNYSGATHVAVVRDLPSQIGADKPPMIGVYRPDVYAIDAPLTRVIVGEAKTTADLQTPHSRGQLIAYLQFLRHEPNPVLILAVPWNGRGAAQAMLHIMMEQLRINNVTTVVVDDVQELA